MAPINLSITEEQLALIMFTVVYSWLGLIKTARARVSVCLVCVRGREREGADDWFLLVVICSELPVFFASLPVLLAGGGSVSTSCNEERELYSLCYENATVSYFR